jgi:predicted glycosyltransferase
MELFYLHTRYFTPDPLVLKQCGLDAGEEYFILRFVSWSASHDIGHKGLSYSSKKKVIERLAPRGKVFISSEGSLPEEFEKYRIRIKPAHLHHFLAFATLYIGEGSTTASECAVLGTPNIYINSLEVGYCKEQEQKYGLCTHLKSEDGLIEKIDELISDPELKSNYQERRQRMLADKIDGTAFLAWFVQNYPGSADIMKSDSNYQEKFK